MAGALGRGMGSLVNAHDPEAIGLSGLGPDIYEAGPGRPGRVHLDHDAVRRDAPPPLFPSRLGGLGVLTGAAELVFDAFLTRAASRPGPSPPPPPSASASAPVA